MGVYLVGDFSLLINAPLTLYPVGLGRQQEKQRENMHPYVGKKLFKQIKMKFLIKIGLDKGKQKCKSIWHTLLHLKI